MLRQYRQHRDNLRKSGAVGFEQYWADQALAGKRKIPEMKQRYILIDKLLGGEEKEAEELQFESCGMKPRSKDKEKTEGPSVPLSPIQ